MTRLFRWLVNAVLIHTLGSSLAIAATQASATATQEHSSSVTEAPSQAQHDVEAFVNLGFSHWFGETFGAPPGMTTPALVLGVRPGMSLLELRAHYTVSMTKHALPTGSERSVVGFANLDVLFNRELRVSGERMILQFGPAAGFVHVADGLGFAYGAVLAARYMIDLGEHVALGPFFDVRWQLYDLPRSKRPVYDLDEGQLEVGHSDAQSHIGVALSFW